MDHAPVSCSQDETQASQSVNDQPLSPVRTAEGYLELDLRCKLLLRYFLHMLLFLSAKLQVITALLSIAMK